MKFRTEYSSQPSSFTLTPDKPVVMAGSCFSQNIAAKMSECGWENINPGGTLYNPVSIGKVLDILLDRENGLKKFINSLFLSNGLWNSHLFDSSVSSSKKDDCVEEFTIRQRVLLDIMTKADAIIVTFGTSVCYHLVENNEIVGNCHKQPSVLFYRKRLEIGEIADYWTSLIRKFKERFPEMHFIFTVSPVRHLKDGFSGNSRSKAVLQLAVEKICQDNPECMYFPAFEILNDDLRDYRFYAEDLVHPSAEGISYIWEKFRETFLDEKGNKILEEGARRQKTQTHRPKKGALGKELRPNT